MNQFHQQLKNEADSVRMTSAERRALREQLVSYMEYHPLPHAAVPTRFAAAVHAVKMVTHNFYARRAVGAFTVMVLILVPFVAERAVPGDVLYPVKVRFNEEVQSTLNRSPYEQVAWETERLERRLSEARVLEREGKLTPEVAAQVAEAVKLHSDAAQKSIASIRESDSDEAAIAEIAFSSVLAVQSEMLAGGSDTLSTAVASARQIAYESQQNNKPSYEKLLGRIEQESTSAYELFNTITEQASVTERRDMERRLENVRRTVDKAAAMHETNPDEAVAMLTTALTDTRKVISFMTDIDVREHVTIDELVPEGVTEAERIARIGERLTAVAALSETITARLASVDTNTRVAVEARLTEMHADAATASTSLAAEDTDTADEASLKAHTTAQELIVVLDQYDAEIGGGAATTTEEATTTTPAPPAATTTGTGGTRSTSTVLNGGDEAAV